MLNNSPPHIYQCLNVRNKSLLKIGTKTWTLMIIFLWITHKGFQQFGCLIFLYLNLLSYMKYHDELGWSFQVYQMSLWCVTTISLFTDFEKWKMSIFSNPCPRTVCLYYMSRQYLHDTSSLKYGFQISCNENKLANWGYKHISFLIAHVSTKKNKSSIKCLNILSCLDQHMYRGLGLWNSPDCEAV